MIDARRLRADLLAFSVAIGHPLTAAQADAMDVFRRAQRETAVVGPRRSGKTRSAAVCALWHCFGGAARHALVISAAEDRAKDVLALAAGIARDSPLLAGSIADVQTQRLTLSTGSAVRCVAATDAGVRGNRAQLVIADEAAQIPDAILLGAARPIIASEPGGRLLLISSALRDSGAFFDAISRGDAGSEYTASFRWSLADAPWIDAADVRAAREQLPPEVFAAEYEGRFVDADAAWRVIERADIDAAQARTLDPGADPADFGSLGVDVGRGGDESVIVHVRGGQARVVFAERTGDLMVLVGRVARVAADTGAAVAVDATGMGWGIHDALAARHIGSSAFVAAGRAQRAERYLNARAEVWFALRDALKADALDLDPADKVLAAQLATQRYRLATDGRIALEDKATMRGGSPDRGDALAVALWGARQSAAWSAWRRLERERAPMAVHPLVASAESLPPGQTGLTDDLLDVDW